MTMQQVSKGEFDRRVKLLEQKVQQSANKLMNDYKEFVERINSINSDNADFNRYAAIVDRINSCFDTNGQFDGSHIAPLSIETAALSVGQRSQSLNLRNVKFEVKEYTRGTNNYGVLRVTDENGDQTSGTYGELTHYTLFDKQLPNGEFVGDVAYFDVCYEDIVINNLTPVSGKTKSDLWYIYIKLPCEAIQVSDNKKIFLCDNTRGANIYISQEQIVVDGKYSTTDKYLYVQLGTISKEFSGTRDGVNYIYRIVDLNYGLTTINGRLITTGRIEGSTQNGAWFDLDQGIIGGNIQFNSAWNDNINSYLTSNNYAQTSYVDNKTGIKYITETLYYSTSSDQMSTPSAPNSRITNDGVSAGSWSLKVPTSGYFYYTCTQSYGIKNNTIYDFTHGNVIYDQALTTSATALKGTTTIAGGLLLSQKIITGSGNNCAVLNGTDSYSFWAGNSSASYAPVWIKRDGSAYFNSVIIDNSYFKMKNESFSFYYDTDFYTDTSTGVVVQHGVRLKFHVNNFSSSYDYIVAVRYNYTGSGSSQTVAQIFYPESNDVILSENVNSISSIRFIKVKKTNACFTIYNNGFVLKSRISTSFALYMVLSGGTNRSINVNISQNTIAYRNNNLITLTSVTQ